MTLKNKGYKVGFNSIKSVRLFYLVLIALLLIMNNVPAQTFERANNRELISTISGALLYLEDSQLRLKKAFWKKNDQLPQKNAGKTSYYYLTHYALDCYNKRNNDVKTAIWESHIQFIPQNLKIGSKAVFVVPDDNLYISESIIYPFYLFRDIEGGGDYLTVIKYKTNNRIHLFKRGKAYNFWMEYHGVYGNTPRTGPANIPIGFIKKFTTFMLSPFIRHYYNELTAGLDVVPRNWLLTVRSKANPTGEDALFNIPNDADDTSMGVVLQRLLHNEYATLPPSSCYYQVAVDTEALNLVSKFRDVNRVKEDGRDRWKGKSTGAYLTWLKREDLPVFSSCETGVIPLGVNNVDVVINANILFSLSLNQRQGIAGYTESLYLLKRVIFENKWKEASLYYPQKLMFPYALSRAWRDGNIKDTLMQEAVARMLTDLIALQQEYGKDNPFLKGAFPGGKEKSDDFSTALGLCALLNIGENVAVKRGIRRLYHEAIEAAVRFLIKEKRPYKMRYTDSFGRKTGKYKRATAPKGYQWEEGAAFSSSFSDLAHWSSRPLVAAIVLEALTKYVLAYDKQNYNIQNGPKIYILSYPRDAVTVPMKFEIRYSKTKLTGL